MFGQWVFQMERLPSLLAAMVLIALVAWLLWFDSGTRLHRAFALLLILKAFFLGLVSFGTSALDPAMVLRMYFAIAIPFAAVYFALVFRFHHAPTDRPRRPPSWPLALGLALLAGGFMVLLALRSDLYHDGTQGGPLGLFSEFSYTAFAFIALMFGRLALTMEAGKRRSALLLGALALSLEPLYQATVQTLIVPINFAMGRVSLQVWIEHPFEFIYVLFWITTAALLVMLVALLRRGVIGTSQRMRESMRGDSRRVLLAMLLPFCTGVLVLGARMSDRFLGTGMFIDLHWGMDALWIVAGAALIVYAAVQHHFLDSRSTLRLTVRTSTLVGILLLVFFVVKELLEEVLKDLYPVLPGLAAAGIAVLLLHPVLLLVGKNVRRWMPATTPLASLKLDDRLAVYRSQVEVVWMDRVISRKERRLLDRMRERLDIPTDTADQIEREIIGSPVVSRTTAKIRARTDSWPQR